MSEVDEPATPEMESLEGVNVIEAPTEDPIPPASSERKTRYPPATNDINAAQNMLKSWINDLPEIPRSQRSRRKQGGKTSDSHRSQPEHQTTTTPEDRRTNNLTTLLEIIWLTLQIVSIIASYIWRQIALRYQGRTTQLNIYEVDIDTRSEGSIVNSTSTDEEEATGYDSSQESIWSATTDTEWDDLYEQEDYLSPNDQVDANYSAQDQDELEGNEVLGDLPMMLEEKPTDYENSESDINEVQVETHKTLKCLKVPVVYLATKPHIQVQVEDQSIHTDALLDSGARPNIVHKSFLEEIEEKTNKTFEIKSSHTTLKSFSQNTICILGLVSLTIMLSDPNGARLVCDNLPFYVTNQDQPNTRRLLIGSQFMIDYETELRFGNNATDSPTLTVRKAKVEAENGINIEHFLNPDVLTLNQDVEFEPQEIKIIEIQARKLISRKLRTGETGIELNMPELKYHLMGLTSFNDQMTTKIMVSNETQDHVRMKKNTPVGRLLGPDELFKVETDLIEQISRTRIPENIEKQCFCQNKDSIILFLTTRGHTQFPNENRLTFEGKVAGHGPIFYEAPTRRLYIDRNCTINELRTSPQLKQIPAEVKVRVAIKDQHLSLRELGLISLIDDELRKREVTLEITNFDTRHCKDHQSWRVYNSERVWVHFSLHDYAISAQPLLDKMPLNREVLENEELKFKFWENEVTMNIGNDLKLTFIEVKINSIHQYKSEYLNQLAREFLSMYDNLGCRVAKWMISSDPTPRARNLHEQLQKLPYESRQISEIQDYLHLHNINVKDYLFFMPQPDTKDKRGQRENEETPDLLGRLDLIEKIVAGDEDPLRQEVEDLPRFPAIKDFRNHQIDPDYQALDEEFSKIPAEQRLLDLDRLETPKLAYDNQSEISQLSGWTQTGNLLPHLEDETEQQLNDRIETYLEGLKTKIPLSEFPFYASLIREFKGLFKKTDRDLPTIPGVEFDLKVKEGGEHISKAYPVNAKLMPGVRKLLDDAIHIGLIKKLTNERIKYLSPAFVVRKGPLHDSQGNPIDPNSDPNKYLRLVVNFKHLNDHLETQPAIIPKFEEILSQIADQKWYFAGDLGKFFHTIRLSPQASKLCAFVIGQEAFLPLKILEGISSAPAACSKIGQLTLEGIKTYATNFIDDVLLGSPDLPGLREATRTFFENCTRLNLRLNLDKLTVCSQEIKYLGHIITYKPGIGTTWTPMESRFKLLADWPTPKTTTDLHKYLGTCAFVRTCAANMDFILAPLYRLLATRVKTKTTEPIQFTEMETKSFNLSRIRLSTIRPLAIPSGKFDLMFLIDSSFYGVGSTVLVKQEGKFRVANFFSRRFPDATVRSNSSACKELLGILLTITRYAHLVYLSNSTRIVCDARSVYALILKSQSNKDFGKASRWVSKLHSFGSIIFIHHKTRDFVQISDSLSSRYNIEPLHPEDFENHQSFAKAAYSKISLDSLKMSQEPPPGTELSLEQITKECIQNPKILTVHPNPEELNPDQTNTPTPAILEEQMISHISALDELNINPALERYTAAYFRNKQAKDPTCKEMIEALIYQEAPPAHLSRYHLLNGSLLVRLRNKIGPKTPENAQIVLPTTTLVRLAADYHILYHNSAGNLIKMLRRHYFHPNLKFIATNLCLSCEHCRHSRLLTKTELGPGQLPVPTKPGQILYVDYIIMRPARHLNRTCNAILNITCGLTAFSLATPVSDMLLSTAQKVFQNLINHFPGIECIVSDNQSSLLASKPLKEFLAKKGIKSRTITAYQSTANGIVESNNKSVRRILRLHGQAYRKSWLAIFDEALLALNSMPQAGHKKPSESPYELFFGKTPANTDPLSSLKDAKLNRQEVLKTLVAVKQARFNIHQARVQAIQDQSKIQPGSKVLVLDMLRSNKQQPYYLQDIFTVVARKGYFILAESTDTKKQLRTLVSRVKPFHIIERSIAEQLRPKQRELLGYKEDTTDFNAPSLTAATTNSSTLTSSNRSSTDTSKSQGSMPSRNSTVLKDNQSTSNIPKANQQQTLEPRNMPTTSKPPTDPEIPQANVLEKAKSWLTKTARSVKQAFNPDTLPQLRRSKRLADKLQTNKPTAIPTPTLIPDRQMDPPQNLPKRKYTKRFQLGDMPLRRSARIQAKNDPPATNE